jgi:exodeoxyribonuclease VII large subunit
VDDRAPRDGTAGRAGEAWPGFEWDGELRILTVGEVARRLREAVRGDPTLRDLWVEGEIGRVTISAAGHAYFTLKDERGVLECVAFARELAGSPFEPRTGLHVIAHGRVDVYEQQGRVQLYVDALRPSGFGELALRFEALKAQLAAEGLFDARRKRVPPLRPGRIAVVTSPQGAVWHDIRNVVARRWPLAELVLVPCLVQGASAPPTIVAAFRAIEELSDADRPHVVILARGGGTLEDLWAFNDEAVVRAVAGCLIPVVSGVGHEIDATLVDFAADVRAPTPSAAAELVVPDRADTLATLDAMGGTMRRIARGRLIEAAAALAGERRALVRLGPLAQLDFARERAGGLLDRVSAATLAAVADRYAALDRSGASLRASTTRRVVAGRATLDAAVAALAALDPDATLTRGYAVVRRARDARIVRDPAEVVAGDPLVVRVARGSFDAVAGERSS